MRWQHRAHKRGKLGVWPSMVVAREQDKAWVFSEEGAKKLDERRQVSHDTPLASLAWLVVRHEGVSGVGAWRMTARLMAFLIRRLLTSTLTATPKGGRVKDDAIESLAATNRACSVGEHILGDPSHLLHGTLVGEIQ